MSNLTIALDDDLLKEARIKALKEGTSINAYLRQCLANYVGRKNEAEGAKLAAAFVAHAKRHQGKSEGYRFNRDEFYAGDYRARERAELATESARRK